MIIFFNISGHSGQIIQWLAIILNKKLHQYKEIKQNISSDNTDFLSK